MVSSITTTNNSSIYALIAQQGATGSARNSGATVTSADNSSTAASGQSTNQISTYDFSHMTPNEMKSASASLAASGKLTGLQLLKLQTLGIPAAKVGPDGTAVPLTAAEQAAFANQPFNYTDGIQGIIDNLQQTGYASDPKSGYQDWKSLLSTLQNMQGTTSSVDIAA